MRKRTEAEDEDWQTNSIPNKAEPASETRNDGDETLEQERAKEGDSLADCGFKKGASVRRVSTSK